MHRRFGWLLGLLVCAAALLSPALAGAEAASLPGVGDGYDSYIGTQKQLFVDDLRVESWMNVERVVHEATKLPNPVIVPDRLWESDNVYIYGQVLYDAQDEIFKMWYHTYNRTLGKYLVLYATSDDGITWDKPALGVYDYFGSRANNIVGDMHNASVIKDLGDADPSRRYKMLTYDYPWACGCRGGYSIYFSPDGIRWTRDARNPILPGDDVITGFYDEQRNRFVAISKRPIPLRGTSRRAAWISYSADFLTWTPQKLILYPDDRDDFIAKGSGLAESDIYGMGVMPYEGLYIGFPWIFTHTEPGGIDGPVDVQIAFSRDLERWVREDRRAVIPRGPQGSFDSGMIYTVSRPIVVGDEIWLYYGGWDDTHRPGPRRAAIGLAKWRLDGFASLVNGGWVEGSVTTRPIRFEGDQLVVNAKVTGHLQAELLDPEGRAIPGFERAKSVAFRGDSTEHVLKWDGDPDLGALQGQPVKIRFYLKGGNLYAYQFRSSD